MDTCDPCDPAVAAWWQEKAADVLANLPGPGGFLVKAASEGRPGPFTYGRTQADGANMLADTVAPVGSHIIWRCFVYNCHQYVPELADMYANLDTCPDEPVLFFHHLPYQYVLHSGKTVLQHIYDTPFEGAEDAARFYEQVVALKPYLDPAVYT